MAFRTIYRSNRTLFFHGITALLGCLLFIGQVEANGPAPTFTGSILSSRYNPSPMHHFVVLTGTRNDAPMALIPAGEFAMGSDRGQDDEQPVHRVSLDSFYLDVYEVTVSRYAEFLTSQKAEPPFKWSESRPGSHSNKPVTGVDWYDARDYCRWLGKRLPTEAEWEMAARGTEGRLYPWGNDHPTRSHVNAGQKSWQGYDTLTNVGRYEAGKSPTGLYDMAGNLWEWVADWYDSTYYQFSPRDNPAGPAAGPLKALRGGAWNNDAASIRSANRAGYIPKARRNDAGFRCARDLKPSGSR